MIKRGMIIRKTVVFALLLAFAVTGAARDTGAEEILSEENIIQTETAGAEKETIEDMSAQQAEETVGEQENEEEGTGNQETGDTDVSGEAALPEDDIAEPGDTGMVSGEYYMEDGATGIVIQAEPSVIMPWVMVVVTPIESGEAFEALNELYSILLDGFQIYDISLFDVQSMQTVQPNGSVMVSVPVPEGFDAGRLAVYSVDISSGTPQRTQLDFTLEDGKAVFQTEHFSLYMIAQTAEELPSYLPPTEEVAQLQLTRQQPSKAVSGVYSVSPKTGDDTEREKAILMMTGVILSCGILFFYSIKREKNKKM